MNTVKALRIAAFMQQTQDLSVVERVELCRGTCRDGKGSVCALLGACWIQAQNQKSDSAKRQGEIDCLKVDLEERDVRPLIETERHAGPHGGSPWSAVCMALWSGPELGELQAKCSRKPGETEPEYLWRVSLTGEDRILLSDDEARGYWGPGVFLRAGPAGDQSITSRVAYWAGGVDPKERGESVTIRVKGLSELTEGSRKVRPAGCKPRPERSRTRGPSGRNYDPGRDDLWRKDHEGMSHSSPFADSDDGGRHGW
ncbi:uncharacterized protein ACIBXB_006284 [Morphnus guianensis]